MRKLILSTVLVISASSVVAFPMTSNPLATRCTNAAKVLLTLKDQQSNKKCLLTLSEGSRLSSLAADAINHRMKRAAKGLLKTATTGLTLTGKMGCAQLSQISEVNAELISISHGL